MRNLIFTCIIIFTDIMGVSSSDDEDVDGYRQVGFPAFCVPHLPLLQHPEVRLTA